MDRESHDNIVRIINRHNPMRTFIFEQISDKKLENAKSSFGQLISSDEKIVLLYDDTMFGGAKDGIILTTKRLYGKNIFESPNVVALEDIAELTFKVGLPSKIIARTKSGGELRFDSGIGGEDLFKALKEIVKFLQSNENFRHVIGENFQASQSSYEPSDNFLYNFSDFDDLKSSNNFHDIADFSNSKNFNDVGNENRRKGGVLRKLKIVDFILSIIISAFVISIGSHPLSAPPRNFFGFAFIPMLTEGMDPEVPRGSLIILREVDHHQLELGDVVTYLRADQTTVTHRIIDIKENYRGGRDHVFRMQGDNNVFPDPDIIHGPNIIGEVIFTNLFLGRIIFSLQNQMILMATIFGLAIMFVLIFKFFIYEPRYKENQDSRLA